MNLLLIDEQEYDAIADTPHNPPVLCTKVAEETFAEEWESARRSLERTLSEYCERNGCTADDFWVVDDRSPTRGLAFSIYTEKLLKPELTSTLQKVLASLKEDYVIFWGPDWTVDKPEMQKHDFSVIVYKDRALGRFCYRSWVHGASQEKNEEAARKLGFM